MNAKQVKKALTLLNKLDKLGSRLGYLIHQFEGEPLLTPTDKRTLRALSKITKEVRILNAELKAPKL